MVTLKYYKFKTNLATLDTRLSTYFKQKSIQIQSNTTYTNGHERW